MPNTGQGPRVKDGDARTSVNIRVNEREMARFREAWSGANYLDRAYKRSFPEWVRMVLSAECERVKERSDHELKAAYKRHRYAKKLALRRMHDRRRLQKRVVPGPADGADEQPEAEPQPPGDDSRDDEEAQ